MNRRGQLSNIVMFFIIILAILAIGLVIAIVGSSVKLFIDPTLSAFTSLPSTPGLNVGNIVAQATTPISAISSVLPSFLGVIYALALIGVLGVAYGFRITGEKYLIVPYFLLALLSIIGSIVISNMYENMYRSGGQLGAGLQAMTLFSWLMLYSPIIITIICFIGGAIIFSGFEEVPV